MHPKIAPEDHTGQGGGILVQNIMEGYVMAFTNILISFKKEIDICLEKVELGWVSNGASLMCLENNRKLDPLDKLSANMGLDKGGLVYFQPNKRFKQNYIHRHLPRKQLCWCMKQKGRVHQPVSKELLETRQSSEQAPHPSPSRLDGAD